MEQRQAMGLDPFAPPCDGPDPWAPRRGLPIYPIVSAQKSVDAVLADSELFRSLVRLGKPTGELQLPPVISMALFERIAELRPESKPVLLSAAKDYVRDSFDANALLTRALELQTERKSDAEVTEAIDASLV